MTTAAIALQRPRHRRPWWMPLWLYKSYLMYLWGEAPTLPNDTEFAERWENELSDEAKGYIRKAAELDFADRTDSIKEAYNKIGTGFTMMAFLFAGGLSVFTFVVAPTVKSPLALWLSFNALATLGLSLAFFAWALMSRFSIWTEAQIDPFVRQFKVLSDYAWIAYLREWTWHRDHVVRVVRKLQQIGLLLTIVSVAMILAALFVMVRPI